MIGIYKITNPNGEIYIGQSKNLESRWQEHSMYSNGRKIAASLKNYGKCNHVFNILHELPKDVNQDIIDRYECLYIEAYKDAGSVLLNIRNGGKRGTHSEETKYILSEKNKRILNEEHKKKISMALTGRKQTDEHKRKVGNSIRGGKNYQAISIKNIITNERYETVLEASNKNNIDRKKLSLMLRGKIYNTTNFRYDP